LMLDTQGEGEILVDGQVRIGRIDLKHHTNIALAGQKVMNDPSVEA
jgi:hypothetical protein